MGSPSLDDLRRAYYLTQLGLTESTATTTALEAAVLSGGGGGGGGGGSGKIVPHGGTLRPGFWVPLVQGSNDNPPEVAVFADQLNRGALIPFSFQRKVTPTAFAAMAIYSVASAVYRFAIYNSDPATFQPTTLKQDYGDVDASVSGAKQWANTHEFAAGDVYWYCLVNRGANSKTRGNYSGFGADTGNSNPATALSFANYGLSLDGVSGAFPSDASAAVGAGVNTYPRIVAQIP